MNVLIIAAMSADGFIAHDNTELANWTSKEDKKLFVELTKRAGVMVMGHTTYKTIGHPLPHRRNIVYSKSDQAQDDIEMTSEAPADLLARLQAEGVTEVAVCGGASIYSLFMQAGVVNEVYITVEPVLFGVGVSLFHSRLDAPLTLLETRKLNDNTVLLHYRVNHS